MAEQLELPEPSEPAEPAESAEPNDGYEQAALAIAARHALHDEELVAAFAADALEADEPGELTRARSLVERCAVCRALHADLLAIAMAHRATASLLRAAPRDFRLSEDDAQRLRPGVAVVRAAPPVPTVAAASAPLPPAPDARPSFIARLGAALGSLTRPLGGALVAAGLVGILVGSVSLSAVPASAPVPAGFDRGGAAAPAESAAAAGLGSEGEPKDLASDSTSVDPRIVVIVGSGGVAVVGLLLLARSRRRAREAPKTAD